MKPIQLCADDYGLSPAISDGILHLLEHKRLTATSCMTNFPHWPVEAQKLRPYWPYADIGLHLNLTEGESLTGLKFLPLKQWILKSHFGLAPKLQIKAEIKAQLKAFMDTMQHFPVFIDGHEYVHQLPGIRGCLLEILTEIKPTSPYYVRVAIQRFACSKDFLKASIIRLLGAQVLKYGLQQRHISFNVDYAGIYDFRHTAQFADYMKKSLQGLRPHGLMVCHPGLPSNDPINAVRQSEWEFLNSLNFQHLLQEQNVMLSRFIG